MLCESVGLPVTYFERRLRNGMLIRHPHRVSGLSSGRVRIALCDTGLIH